MTVIFLPPPEVDLKMQVLGLKVISASCSKFCERDSERGASPSPAVRSPPLFIERLRWSKIGREEAGTEVNQVQPAASRRRESEPAGSPESAAPSGGNWFVPLDFGLHL